MGGMLGTRQPIKKKAPLGATALPGDLSGAGGYGSGVVMPFVGAPACLQGRVICEPCEHITRPSRVSCASRTRGGRHAVAGRKRASTTERPLPRIFLLRFFLAMTNYCPPRPEPGRAVGTGGLRAGRGTRGATPAQPDTKDHREWQTASKRKVQEKKYFKITAIRWNSKYPFKN